MSGGEFEAEIRNGIRQLQSNVEGLTRSIGVANRGTKELGKESNKAFKEAGEAVKRMGGPLGEAIAKIGGATGMRGGLAQVAAAALVAGIAFKAYNAVVDANIERTRKQIEAAHELEDAELSAAKSREQHGLAAVQSQGADLRRLVTRGGRKAVDEAEDISRDKTLGIEAADARRGVANSFTIPAHLRDNRSALIRVAKMVAASGESSFSEAIDQVLSSPELLARLRNGSDSDVARRVVVKRRGQIPTIANLDQAGQDITGRTAELRQGGQGLAGIIKEIIAIASGEDVTGRKEIEDGTAEIGTRKHAAAVADPKSAALVELSLKQSKVTEDLTKLATEQGRILGLLADVFQPGGSFQTQIDRLNSARGRAVAGGD